MHQDNVAPVGFVSESYCSLVHTQVPLKKALLDPKCLKALDDEWEKLATAKVPNSTMRGAWQIDQVKPRAEVEALADKTGEENHFGELMEICHIKNSQLPEHMQRAKGRVVFRGDDCRDQDGNLAVFSEQGVGASHLAAAKVLHLYKRVPGNEGEDSDAMSAYTQCLLDGPKTWIM